MPYLNSNARSTRGVLASLWREASTGTRSGQESSRPCRDASRPRPSVENTALRSTPCSSGPILCRFMGGNGHISPADLTAEMLRPVGKSAYVNTSGVLIANPTRYPVTMVFCKECAPGITICRECGSTTNCDADRHEQMIREEQAARKAGLPLPAIWNDPERDWVWMEEDADEWSERSGDTSSPIENLCSLCAGYIVDKDGNVVLPQKEGGSNA